MDPLFTRTLEAMLQRENVVAAGTAVWLYDTCQTAWQRRDIAEIDPIFEHVPSFARTNHETWKSAGCPHMILDWLVDYYIDEAIESREYYQPWTPRSAFDYDSGNNPGSSSHP